MTPDAWAEHADQLAALVPRALHPAGGFGWLDPTNTLAPGRGVATWITCRMTHVAALATLRHPEAGLSLAQCLDHGAKALDAGGLLRDDRHGGWFSGVVVGDEPGVDGTKAAYAHAFVILASASLTAVGHPQGRSLLEDALSVFDLRFWDEAEGMARESWDRRWRASEPYRGVNANMHTVEAMLAAGEVLRDPSLTDRARRIVDRVVCGYAREADWRLPEHFTDAWEPQLDYNRERADDQFRPFGVTIGHVLEWARLALNTRAAVARDGTPRPDLLEAAAAMFAAAMDRGWAVDGSPGLVYTTDFADQPVVRQRLHWVLCEAFATAAALHHETNDSVYRQWLDTLWGYAEEHLIDHENGGWLHELGPDNTPDDSIWWGKPDIYHAYQAALVPSLPSMVSFAGSVGSPDLGQR
ncbi:AGE family epimerase/isomerase [Oryzihumus sp.]|uniref:AGE family epimerase/isomerase n=1 Tax=Oryzihumus sp. TaxID=1968903 RepID=UPI002ED8C744